MEKLSTKIMPRTTVSNVTIHVVLAEIYASRAAMDIKLAKDKNPDAQEFRDLMVNYTTNDINDLTMMRNL